MFNLKQAIATVKAESERLHDELKRVRVAIAALQGLGTNGGNSRVSANGPSGRKPHRMSAAGRKRISRAQKARWAKWKAQQGQRAA